MAETSLQRVDLNPIPEGGGPECRATLVVRNELLRLPWLLQYYRNLGVTRFFITDNGSEDDTLAFLSTQKDCHVFVTRESFAASKSGMNWHRQILGRYGETHWWLMIDADELLVYPGCEALRLPALCRYLDSTGAEGLYTLLLDMYGKGPLAEAVYQTGQNFLDVCPYFDSDYVFCPRLGNPFSPPFPREEPIGGPRLRLFYPEFVKWGQLKIGSVKLLRKLRNSLRRLGIHLPLTCAVPPILFKIPLFKSRPGLQLVNNHHTAPLRLAQITGALLHFKFFSDFHARVLREAKRGEHFDGASEYARYFAVTKQNPEALFYCKKSLKYLDSAQLAGLGLIRDTDAFKNWRNPVQAH